MTMTKIRTALRNRFGDRGYRITKDGDDLMKLRYPILGLIASITALALIGGDDEPVASSRQYCEMVQIHKDSGGEYGWPAFRGEAECREFSK